jgi:hypothetical protein
MSIDVRSWHREGLLRPGQCFLRTDLLSYQAWRRNVSGIVKGPLPFFWGVSKTA